MKLESLQPTHRFVLVFAAVLAGGWTALSLRPVDAAVVEPFTAWLAQVASALLNLLGQKTNAHGTIIRGAEFAVNLRNGCNGLEAVLVYVAAVVAFPSSLVSRTLGAMIGAIVLQMVNLGRIVALYLVGLDRPEVFDGAHTTVGQLMMMGVAFLVWWGWVGWRPVQRLS